MSPMNPPFLKWMDFSRAELDEAIANERALALGLFYGYGCELACRMCYASTGGEVKNMVGDQPLKRLAAEEYDDLLDQAVEHGIKVVGISGEGEPMMNTEGFFDLVGRIRDRRLGIVVETNGVKIDREVAERLRDCGASVIGKCFSLDPAKNDYMVGKTGVYEYVELDGARVPSHIKHLIDVGMAADCRVGVNTVITSDNHEEVETIWRWMREHDLIPYMEFMVHLGYAKNGQEDLTDDARLEIHERVRALDARLGYDYPLSLGLYPGPRTCDNRFVAMIDLFGNSKVCACTYFPIGNIRDDRLDQIIARHYEIEHKLGRVYANDSVRCECEKTIADPSALEALR